MYCTDIPSHLVFAQPSVRTIVFVRTEPMERVNDPHALNNNKTNAAKLQEKV